MAYTTIDNPGLFFNTVLYTGSGNAQTISGVGFQPDWLWQKSRSASQDPRSFDAVRGGSKLIYPSLNNAQATDAQLITSFNADGFTMGTSGSNANDSSVTYAAWNWKANGQGSSNTDGSINTTYTSANTTSGFSISMYEGTGSNATVGHGLGAVPKVVLVKGLDVTSQWYMYNAGAGANKVGLLDNSSAFATDTVSWQNTTPTSSVFSIGNDGGTNSSGNTMIAYCFAEKKGYSKFGSFVGNGEPAGDAPFIYTGFKPAFLIIKSSTYAESWIMTDNKRLGYNGSAANFRADTSNAEITDSGVNPDLLSNGFSLQNNDNSYNKNGQSYIYWAFAESPFVTSTGVPSTAG
tara:strand:+ start:723 stop:1769 length:1047 start_codon:yes stop_codon:yes gene_type:complete